MRTSWMMSRRVVPASKDQHLGSVAMERRAARAWLAAGLVLGLVLGLSGCGSGGGSGSATRPSTERSGTGPAPSVTESPSVTATGPTTRPTRTSPATPTSDETPTSAEPPTTAPASSAEALAPTSAPTAPTAAESEGLGALGWVLLAVLVVGLVAGWLIWRSRRRSAWDAQAGALEADTRTATSTQLPSVLTAETAGQRALSWPPLRAGLVDLIARWDLLAERAPEDRRRNWSEQVRSLLQELVAAVDAENEALATGRDWRLLRPRVDEIGRALSAVLTGGPQQVQPVGGEPTPGGGPPPDAPM